MYFFTQRTFGVLLFSYLFLIINVEAQSSGDVSFDRGHPNVNERVEGFANELASALFVGFQSTEVEFQRSGSGEIVNNMRRGELQGTFRGVLASNNQTSEIFSNFSVQMGVEQQRGREYEILVRTQGEISNSSLFIAYYLNDLSVKCESTRVRDWSFYQRQLCPVVQSGDLNSTTNVLEKANLIARTLKLGLLREVEDSTDRQLVSIKDEFLNYLDQNIQIELRSDELHINVGLSELASLFRGSAGTYLNDRNLIDYSYDRIEIRVTSSSIQFDYQMTKFHVISAFNTAMLGLAQMQDTLEDPQAGQSVGERLREGQGLKTALSRSAHWSDLISTMGVTGMDRIFGPGDDESNNGGSASDLEELGLD